MAAPGSIFGQTRTWTTSQDFDQGEFVNLNPATVVDQLQINTWSETKDADPAVLPYLWVACSVRGTVVRIATSTFDPLMQETVSVGDVLGEYWVAPDGCRVVGNPNSGPSRTTVDFDGDMAAAFDYIDSTAPAKPSGHDCPGSSQQSQGGGSGSESSSPAVSTTLDTTESLTAAEDGTPATFVTWFPDFLSELELPEFETYDGLDELLRQLATWAVENLTKDQRGAVASALSDPSRTFADSIVAAKAQDMAGAIAP